MKLPEIKKKFKKNINLYYNDKKIIFIDFGTFRLYHTLTVRLENDNDYTYLNLEDIHE